LFVTIVLVAFFIGWVFWTDSKCCLWVDFWIDVGSFYGLDFWAGVGTSRGLVFESTGCLKNCWVCKKCLNLFI
jgi:hypothetical protein